MKRKFRWQSLAGLALLALVGCDDPKSTQGESEAPSATTKVTNAMVSAALSAAAAEAPPPEQPKKKKVCSDSGDLELEGDLEAELRKKLEKPTGKISKGDLKRVRSINLAQTRIDELDPCVFPHLTGLKHLFLGAGKLEDLSPIAGLKQLEGLRASLNRVEDISPLSELTRLDQLDLGHTKVKDLKPLENLENLTELLLDSTPVSDLSPLAKLTKLERLSIQNTQVKDLSPLKELTKLKFLYIKNSPIDDPFVLGPLKAKGLQIFDE